MKHGPAITGLTLLARARAGLERAPLFVAAVLFAVGVLFARVVWIEPADLLLAILPLAAVAVVAALRAVRVAPLVLVLLWGLLGAWCAEMEPQPSPDAQLLSLSDGLMRTVEGIITDAAPLRHEVEEQSGHPPVDVTTQRIDLRLASVELADDVRDEQTPLQGMVRLTVRWKSEEPRPFRCGEQVRADARLLPPLVYRDPGAWDVRDYLLQQGITSTASVKAESIGRIAANAQTGASSGSFGCLLKTAQHTASERLATLTTATQRWPAWLRVSNDDAAMLAAMVSGDRTYLHRSLRVGFERTGSFHMLVVSGFHLAIVAGCVLWLARKLRMSQVPATLLTLATASGFALFTGFAAPVRRSLFMVALYLIGRLFYRERGVLNTIGFAGLCLLAVSPRSLFDASFQMTMLAVLSIGGFALPILHATLQPYVHGTRDLRRTVLDPKLAPAIAQFRIVLRMFAARLQSVGLGRRAWMFVPGSVRTVLRVCEAVFVSLVIELTMTLPMAIYFHRITVFALPVNVLILPVLLLLLPAALVTLLVLLVWPAAAAVPAACTALCLHEAVLWIHVFGTLRFGDIRLPMPHPWQVTVFWIGLAISIVLARSHSAFGRRLGWLVIAVAAAAPLIPNRVQHTQRALLVEAIDVGQGDSLLLVSPDGKTLLVDAGGLVNVVRPSQEEFDIGEEVVSAALWQRGIRHLDAVAITHAHLDHMGGMPAVLRNFHPDELWVGNNPPSFAYKEVLDEAERAGTRVRSFRAGDRIVFGGAIVDVFAPAADYHPGKAAGNNDSLVLRAEYQGASILLQGDAEAPVEQRMLADGAPRATLLKVGHHGSITSTRPEFLRGVAPQCAVISCGLRNHFGHPRAEILDELQSSGVRTFSTDIMGAVCFRIDAEGAHPVSCISDE